MEPGTVYGPDACERLRDELSRTEYRDSFIIVYQVIENNNGTFEKHYESHDIPIGRFITTPSDQIDYDNVFELIVKTTGKLVAILHIDPNNSVGFIVYGYISPSIIQDGGFAVSVEKHGETFSIAIHYVDENRTEWYDNIEYSVMRSVIGGLSKVPNEVILRRRYDKIGLNFILRSFKACKTILFPKGEDVLSRLKRHYNLIHHWNEHETMEMTEMVNERVIDYDTRKMLGLGNVTSEMMNVLCPDMTEWGRRQFHDWLCDPPRDMVNSNARMDLIMRLMQDEKREEKLAKIQKILGDARPKFWRNIWRFHKSAFDFESLRRVYIGINNIALLVYRLIKYEHIIENDVANGLIKAFKTAIWSEYPFNTQLPQDAIFTTQWNYDEIEHVIRDEMNKIADDVRQKTGLSKRECIVVLNNTKIVCVDNLKVFKKLSDNQIPFKVNESDRLEILLEEIDDVQKLRQETLNAFIADAKERTRPIVEALISFQPQMATLLKYLGSEECFLAIAGFALENEMCFPKWSRSSGFRMFNVTLPDPSVAPTGLCRTLLSSKHDFAFSSSKGVIVRGPTGTVSLVVLIDVMALKMYNRGKQCFSRSWV